MLQMSPRYRDMSAEERTRYRKELKSRLIALTVVYLAFTAWWVLSG